MQVLSFAAATGTHPGSPPSGWTVADEVDGTHLVPLRARPVRRLGGEVILGFDHYCFWIGAPIGLRNRKFFMLYLLWSVALCAFGRFVLSVEADVLLPKLEVAGSSGGSGGGRAARAEHVANEPSELFMAFAILQAGSFGDVWSGPSPEMRRYALALENLPPSSIRYVVCAQFVCSLNECAMVVLGAFWLFHVVLILCNRTTCLPPGEAVYNVGSRRNWMQVMGRQWWLWALPVWLGDAPQGTDGLQWPQSLSSRRSVPE